MALLTVKQAAYILKVHPLSVRRYIRERKLPAIKMAGNIRIREEDLSSLNREMVSHPKRPRIEQKPSKIYTFEDPLWRLNGRAASLSLPEPE